MLLLRFWSCSNLCSTRIRSCSISSSALCFLLSSAFFYCRCSWVMMFLVWLFLCPGLLKLLVCHYSWASTRIAFQFFKLICQQEYMEIFYLSLHSFLLQLLSKDDVGYLSCLPEFAFENCCWCQKSSGWQSDWKRLEGNIMISSLIFIVCINTAAMAGNCVSLGRICLNPIFWEHNPSLSRSPQAPCQCKNIN